MFTRFFTSKKNKQCVASFDKHYNALNKRYLNVYGDVIAASRAKKSEEMLAYQAENIGIKNGMRLLDAGCGVCGPARCFASNFDVKIEEVTAAKIQAEAAIIKNEDAGLSSCITVKYEDFHSLSEEYSSVAFNAVYFFESFCHSNDIYRVIAEVYKVLKPRGVLFMKDWFVATRLKEWDPRMYEYVKRRLNEFHSFNLIILKKVLMK